MLREMKKKRNQLKLRYKKKKLFITSHWMYTPGMYADASVAILVGRHTHTHTQPRIQAIPYFSHATLKNMGWPGYKATHTHTHTHTPSTVTLWYMHEGIMGTG
jgi:hypothetical protein